MFDRILVPLDGSTLAEKAIYHAELFARIFGSTIILLRVMEPASYPENTRAIDPLTWQIHKAEAETYLQGVALRIREDLGEVNANNGIEMKSRVDFAIREGKSAENIVDFAHSENIELVIISTHGSSGLSRWNISSVAQKVINLIYLPVLIVRAYDCLETGIGIDKYRKILLPIDSSRRAECSLSAAIELARGEMGLGRESDDAAGETRLVLAAVIRPPEFPIPEPFPVEISQRTEQLLQLSRQAVNQYLEEMKGRLPVNCEICVVEDASVASAIQNMADKEDIDIVVLCAHGYSGQAAWPYGTVARNYMEHGTKSVLVIQDVPRSHVRPTAAAVAAEKSGRR